MERTITEDQRTEIVLLCQDETIPYAQIAEQYEITDVTVSRIARDAGIHRRPRSASLSLNEQIALKRQELEELLLKKKMTEIRFDWQDETTVIVYGVDAKFIELEGIAKFREFITKSINKGGKRA